MLFFILWACGSPSEKNEETDTDIDTFEQIEPEDSEEENSEEDPCGWQENQNADPLSLVGDQECGAQVYAQHCSVCHMEDGSGGNSGKRLTGRMDLFDDEQLMNIIVSGQGTMPPISIFSQKTADVIVFLRETF